jgi:hypothetical protein
MEQAVLTFPNVNHIITLKLASLAGTAPQATLTIGTTSGGTDILAATVISDTAEHEYDVLPTAETIYVRLSTVGSTAQAIIKVEYIRLSQTDVKTGSLIEHNTNEWRNVAWNSTHGYPKYGIINNQRLITAANTAEPQTVWASVLGNYLSHAFTTPLRDTDAFNFKPSTDRRNGIKWLLEKDGLKVGTADAIWRVFAASGGGITPSDINIEVDEAEGSLDLKPIVAHNAIIMTPQGASPALELVSSLEAKGFVARDIGSQAEHLFKNRRIVSWAFAKDPDSVIWCVLDNGTLLGLVYHRRNGISGWFTRTCSLGEGYADVAVIPNSNDDNIDDVYLLVDRGDSLTSNYMVEIMYARITPREAGYGQSQAPSDNDYHFLDSALTYDGDKADIQSIPWGVGPTFHAIILSTAHGYSDADNVRLENTGHSSLNGNVYEVSDKTANSYKIKDIDTGSYITLPNVTGPAPTGGESRKMVKSITGLDHLEGETVTALADGAARENLTVSSGAITLPVAASYVHAGLPYDCLAETLDLEGVFQSGTSQGRNKAISSVDVYFTESRDCKVYPSTDTTNERTIEFEDEAYGEEPPPLFDGVKEVNVQSETAKQVRLVFKQDKPYPLHILRAVIDVDFKG